MPDPSNVSPASPEVAIDPLGIDMLLQRANVTEQQLQVQRPAVAYLVKCLRDDRFRDKTVTRDLLVTMLNVEGIDAAANAIGDPDSVDETVNHLDTATNLAVQGVVTKVERRAAELVQTGAVVGEEDQTDAATDQAIVELVEAAVPLSGDPSTEETDDTENARKVLEAELLANGSRYWRKLEFISHVGRLGVTAKEVTQTTEKVRSL